MQGRLYIFSLISCRLQQPLLCHSGRDDVYYGISLFEIQLLQDVQDVRAVLMSAMCCLLYLDGQDTSEGTEVLSGLPVSCQQ